MTELLAQIYIHTESHTHFFYLFIYFFVDCFLNNFFSLWVFRQALFCEPDTFFSFSIVADVGACTVSFRLESNDFWFFHHIVYITLFFIHSPSMCKLYNAFYFSSSPFIIRPREQCHFLSASFKRSLSNSLTLRNINSFSSRIEDTIVQLRTFGTVHG